MVAFFKAFGFFTWFQSFAPQCGRVTMMPICVKDVPLCSLKSECIAIATFEHAGLVACNENELFVSFQSEVHAFQSVADMQNFLCE